MEAVATSSRSSLFLSKFECASDHKCLPPGTTCWPAPAAPAGAVPAPGRRHGFRPGAGSRSADPAQGLAESADLQQLHHSRLDVLGPQPRLLAGAAMLCPRRVAVVPARRDEPPAADPDSPDSGRPHQSAGTSLHHSGRRSGSTGPGSSRAGYCHSAALSSPELSCPCASPRAGWRYRSRPACPATRGPRCATTLC